ncbi:hypothetical protein FPV67DRAFT_1671890 [Lyophyllum atratum]|nr:hypothetical protein FPV67DRAFT_1671890 [Lyophyllum atratum]
MTDSRDDFQVYQEKECVRQRQAQVAIALQSPSRRRLPQSSLHDTTNSIELRDSVEQPIRHQPVQDLQSHRRSDENESPSNIIPQTNVRRAQQIVSLTPPPRSYGVTPTTDKQSRSQRARRKQERQALKGCKTGT